ncbi:hypothetical protein PF005_g28226 [Phytophthora fragariae]|uniref:Uncharacterized protein n=1 Tax=Phytophthora fragariae TaxID=53985 RepID=A0A6A3DJ45_9STRA|nr:hypothetical protein PF003_g8664 [Phytophthora fragariae]KAE8920925.1 hypothetical protein PF009_g28786 [Phytophthora fragariae]KAE8968310.1 hypothetical protein PF011_g27224 [Phytophthora fragariae]KAE9059164.1 hypothetical protein PF010_g30730 [Phytophthora fragariae]KAE9063763.1 hypothetical protein PF006_g30864 [Phytophthora fragariae]
MSCKVVVIDSGEDKRKGYGVKHFIDFKGDVVAQVTGRGAHGA